MSCDPCDFERYINGDDTPAIQTIEGEWLKMIFPVGTMPIYTANLDPNPQWFLSIEFTEEGKAYFIIQETDHSDGYRTGKEHTICGFAMSPELLNRIARVARS